MVTQEEIREIKDAMQTVATEIYEHVLGNDESEEKTEE